MIRFICEFIAAASIISWPFIGLIADHALQ